MDNEGSCTRRRSGSTVDRGCTRSLPGSGRAAVRLVPRHEPEDARGGARRAVRLHTAQPWEDHAGDFGEFMVRGWLEQLPSLHPAVTARPGQTPYGLVHYACSIEEAVATKYSNDEMPVYRRWKPSSGHAIG